MGEQPLKNGIKKISDSIFFASSQHTHLNTSLWFFSVAVPRKRSSLFTYFLDNEQDKINEVGEAIIKVSPEKSRIHPDHSPSNSPRPVWLPHPLCSRLSKQGSRGFKLSSGLASRVSCWTDMVLDPKDNDYVAKYNLVRNPLQWPTQARVGGHNPSLCNKNILDPFAPDSLH